MTRETKRLLNEALHLSETERSELAAKLIESLDGSPDEDVDAAWAAEIERRCAALDSGDAVTTDWETFRRQIEKDLFAGDVYRSSSMLRPR